MSVFFLPPISSAIGGGGRTTLAVLTAGIFLCTARVRAAAAGHEKVAAGRESQR